MSSSTGQASCTAVTAASSSSSNMARVELLKQQIEKLRLEVSELRELRAANAETCDRGRREPCYSLHATAVTKCKNASRSASNVESVDLPSTSHHLCVVDFNTRERFLVDTGADISVLAVRNKHWRDTSTSEYQLYAANKTPIRIYGERKLDLNLGLRRSFRWTFVVADVKTSILGADFLRNHRLIVDLHHRKLLDQVTELNVDAIRILNQDSAVFMVNRDHTYHDILSKFPDVLRPMSPKAPAKHSVTHYIETTGPPLYARPRPLPPDKYKAAKLEFEKMMEMGVCQPSKSPRASPLHVVDEERWFAASMR